jgi:D-alanine-D-alanine ligase
MPLIYTETLRRRRYQSQVLPHVSYRSVLIVTGGAGPEREGSLTSAAHSSEALCSMGFQCTVRDLNELSYSEVRQYDVVFLAIHGWYGEDGKLQGTLELAGVPYNGSGVAASAVSMHKPLCNRIAESAGLSVPAWEELNTRGPNPNPKRELEIIAQFHGQVFLKPTSGGGSIGAGVVGDAADFTAKLSLATTKGLSMMACRRIVGVDVTVGLIEVEGDVVVLPPLATYYESEFYDYTTKHDPQLRRHECPPQMRGVTIDALRQDALRMYRAVGCRGYARVDFLVDDNGTPWFLEINTLPGLSRQGNLALMARAHGFGYDELILKILATAAQFPGYRP